MFALRMFGLTLVIKLTNFDFKVIEYFLIEKMMSDLLMSCQTVSDLVL